MEVGEEYNGQKSVDEFYLDYIGVYNGYILYYDWYGGKFINEVGGLLFSSKGDILAWKDYKVHSLQELYDNGLLSIANLEKIHLRHQELTYPCYGSYNGYQVFVYRGGWGFESFSCVLAWRDGKTYSLQELYDNGSLTKENIDNIHSKNQWRYDYRIYGDDWYLGLGSYYGMYHGYVIYNTAGYPIKVAIDGLEFDEKVKAVKGGKEYLLKDVYENGSLTREDLEEIYLQHNQFCSRFYNYY